MISIFSSLDGFTNLTLIFLDFFLVEKSILFRGGKVFLSMLTNGNKQAVGRVDASL